MKTRRRAERPAGETHFSEASPRALPQAKQGEGSASATGGDFAQVRSSTVPGGDSPGSDPASATPVSPDVSARKPAARRRRRAERISRADRDIIAEGGKPSWEQIRELEPQKWDGKHDESANESARDREFRENKPPHW